MRILLFLLSLSGLVPDLAAQNLKPASFTAVGGCRVIKPAEYLDRYFVCGENSGRADILQIAYGESGPKVHIFTSRAARTKYFSLINHDNCADFELKEGSKEDRLIQRTFRKYAK